MTPRNRDYLKRDGKARRDVGMALAAAHKLGPIEAGKVAFLRALLSAADGTGTIDDATADLAAEFTDGGKWRGTVPRSLAAAGLIESIGAVKSDRPSRHRGCVTRWRLVDRAKAIAYMAEAVRRIEVTLTTAAELAAAQKETPSAATNGVSVQQSLPGFEKGR